VNSKIMPQLQQNSLYLICGCWLMRDDLYNGCSIVVCMLLLVGKSKVKRREETSGGGAERMEQNPRGFGM